MLIEKAQMRKWLSGIILEKNVQGHDTKGLEEKLNKLPDSYDALMAFAEKLAKLPYRKDWKYVEPSDLAGVKKESCGDWSRPKTIPLNISRAGEKAKTAFLSSVCGCILGKPLECDPDYYEIKKALKKTGKFPLSDYVSETTLEALKRRHPNSQDTTKGNISYVASDDDINYTIIGMLVLENHGLNFTRDQLVNIWLTNLPVRFTFGPERALLLKAGVASIFWQPFKNEWAAVLNLGEERCGAMIRADAYGYACPGLPGLAAELAWRDAYMTHRKTGVYGTMYAAALISLAAVTKDRELIFREALKYVPENSRFHEIVMDQINLIAAVDDFEEAYSLIQKKYGSFTHCNIYMETGTLFNTLKFAKDIGDGICKQVMQGNDTDSYGCTAGSILGAYFGPGHLDKKWLKPFNNEIHAALASFPEQNLTKVTERMGKLPGIVSAGLKKSK